MRDGGSPPPIGYSLRIISSSLWLMISSHASAFSDPPQNQDDLSTTLRNARPSAKARQLSTMIWNRRSLR